MVFPDGECLGPGQDVTRLEVHAEALKPVAEAAESCRTRVPLPGLRRP